MCKLRKINVLYNCFSSDNIFYKNGDQISMEIANIVCCNMANMQSGKKKEKYSQIFNNDIAQCSTGYLYNVNRTACLLPSLPVARAQVPLPPS
jgi:hypothetical protein